jgi:hypothetical protein
MQRLTPTNGDLWTVRWITSSGRDVKHKYFRREVDARRFLDKLTQLDKDAAIFRTSTDWAEVRS